MTSETFKKHLAWILKWEGGYVNHPNDKGGATNKGVTQRTYSAWLRSRKAPDRDVRRITGAEVEAIYYGQYYKQWESWGFPEGTILVAFNIAVNAGSRRAAQLIARAKKAELDHKSKAFTLALINEIDKYYDRIVKGDPSQQVFRAGWNNRTRDLEKTLRKWGQL